MKKHYLLGAVSLLMATLLLLSGCGRVTNLLDQHFPEDTVTEEDLLATEPLPDRERRTYVVLLTTQLESNSTLSTVSLLTFQTATNSIHWLELPTALYVRAAGNTLGGIFSRAYQSELDSESGTQFSATGAAINALRDLLDTGFSISIDYSVNLDQQQFASFMKYLQNIPVKLPVAMGGLSAGEHTLDSKAATDFLLYDQYEDPAEGQFEARRYFAASLRQQAEKVINQDRLSLAAMDLRERMTTDIPSSGGQDIFFLRRFLKTEGGVFQFTNISTRSIYSGGIQYRVLIKDNTRRQLNLQMSVYQDEVTAEQFDPRGLFVDPADQIIYAVYSSTSVLPRVYTLTELLSAEIILESEPEPDTSETPGTSEVPSTAEPSGGEPDVEAT